MNPPQDNLKKEIEKEYINRTLDKIERDWYIKSDEEEDTCEGVLTFDNQLEDVEEALKETIKFAKSETLKKVFKEIERLINKNIDIRNYGKRLIKTKKKRYIKQQISRTNDSLFLKKKVLEILKEELKQKLKELETKE